MKKISILLFLLFTFIGYLKSQTTVSLLLPDNCNKDITSTQKFDKESDIKFLIKPNPNAGSFELHIKSPKNINYASIDIIDYNGKVVFKETIFCNSTTFIKHFDVSWLNNGIYMIVLKNQSIMESTKIIIKK